MFQKTQGIILSHTRYGESSAIVNIFTRELGMRSYMVNGIFGKKMKDKFVMIHPLNIIDLEVYDKPNRDIQRIKDFKLNYIQKRIPFSQHRRVQSFFITEILSHALRHENVNRNLFDFILDAIMFLDSDNGGIDNFHILFLFEFTSFLGFMPDGKGAEYFDYFDLIDACFVDNNKRHSSFLTIEETKLFSRLFSSRRETLSSLAINSAERKMLLQSIMTFYEKHLHQPFNIKSIETLINLF